MYASPVILAVIAIYKILLVCSFFGVILIARPQFIFGVPQGDSSEDASPEERMHSVT